MLNPTRGALLLWSTMSPALPLLSEDKGRVERNPNGEVMAWVH